MIQTVNYYSASVRYYLITSFLLTVNLFTSSAQLVEDFSDGNFTSAPPWSGSTAEFIVNTGLRLQSDNVGFDSSSYLTTTNAMSSLDSMEWQILVRQAFSPSANNFSRVYLVSDQSDLTGALNGYYLQFGESGSNDAVELFEQTGSTSNSVCRATDGMIASSFEIRLKVLRDHLGNWELWIDYSGGYNFVLEASGMDNTHSTSSFFGMFCDYTSSNGDNFYYDDIYSGAYILDTVPPQVISVSTLSATELDVQFDETVSVATAELVSNYNVNNAIGAPMVASRDAVDNALVHLVFSPSFTNGTSYEVTVSGVEDSSSNTMLTQIEPFVYFVSVTPQPRDVLINEIFANPTPQVGLPTEEYVELYNNSSSIFDLNGWVFGDGATTGVLNNYLLMPGEHIILCGVSDTALFSSFGNVMGMSSFPVLNNAGDNLTLTDGTSIIDEVSYADDWYRDPVKAGGGYSLELINPTIPCSDQSNWIGSESTTGGTPGAQNSLFQTVADVVPPTISSFEVYSLDSIKVVFSEALDQAALGSIIITISNGLGLTETIDNQNLSCLWIETSPGMTQGDAFTVTIEGLTDCSGNQMAQETIQINVPEDAEPGDLVINEVLFNPLTGGSDFVEVYNRSDKWIQLKAWSLANWEDSIANRAYLQYNAIIEPGAYVAISRDTFDVQTDYPLYAFYHYYQTQNFPTYNNDSGTVYLITPGSQVSDRFSYESSMHLPLLNSIDGVSLEKIDFSRSSSDATNWHSAAENVGWATPGAINSQYLSNSGMGEVSVEPEVFSPDNDGYQDVVNIHYSFNEPGNVGTVAIYDAQGRLVRWIYRNELLSSSGTVSWDGITETNEKALLGVYVVYFEVFNLDGNIEKYKVPVVVGGRL